MKPIDIQAYAILNAYLAAASDLYKYYSKFGVWPEIGLQLTKIQNVLFDYLDINVLNPLIPISYIKSDSKCAYPMSVDCSYLTPDFVFSPDAIGELYLTLSQQTDQGFKDYFKDIIPEKNLEFWAVTLSPGGKLSSIGALEWAGSENYPEQTTVFTDVAKNFVDLVKVAALEPTTASGISLYETITKLQIKKNGTDKSVPLLLLAGGLFLAYIFLGKRA